MYHAALRASEICKMPKTSHTVQMHNIKLVTEHKKPALKIKLRSYKHSTKTTTPLIVTSTSTTCCPVKAFSKYIKLRSNKPGPAFCHANDHPITRKQLASKLQHHLTMSGHNESNYNTHSFRIGKTTDLAKQGYSYAKIALIGRWNSNAYLKYIKPPTISCSWVVCGFYSPIDPILPSTAWYWRFHSKILPF